MKVFKAFLALACACSLTGVLPAQTAWAKTSSVIAKIEIARAATDLTDSSGSHAPFNLIALAYDTDGQLISDGGASVNWSFSRFPDLESMNKCEYAGDKAPGRFSGARHCIMPDGTIEKVDCTNFWCATLYIPYGVADGEYAVTATAEIGGASAEYSVVVADSGKDRTSFYGFGPSSVSVGTVKGAAPKFTEDYKKESSSYELTLPQCSYQSQYYNFTGWQLKSRISHSGTQVYQPGEICEVSRSSLNSYFEPVWVAKFETPSGLVAKRKGKRVKLSWNRVVGGDGYVVYRAKGKGKFKKVKTIRGERKALWTDAKATSKKKTYRYKVAAFKGSPTKGQTAKTSAVKAKKA